MATLNQKRGSVKRTFGAGIFGEVVAEDCRVVREWIAVAPARWVAAVRVLLLGLDYHATARDAAVCWIQHRGTIDGCPSVAREDWQVVNVTVREASREARRAALRAEADTEQAEPHPYDADEIPAEDEGRDPEDWGRWADRHRYVPTADDCLWNAATSPYRSLGYVVVGRVYRRPATPDWARAQQAHFDGLIPAELADAILSRSVLGMHEEP